MKVNDAAERFFLRRTVVTVEVMCRMEWYSKTSRRVDHVALAPSKAWSKAMSYYLLLTLTSYLFPRHYSRELEKIYTSP